MKNRYYTLSTRKMRWLRLTWFAIGFMAALAAMTAAARANVTPVPIRAGIVQCGPKRALPAACRRDARCCTLIRGAVAQ